MIRPYRLWVHNIGQLATMSGSHGLGLIKSASVLVNQMGEITWAGVERDFPKHLPIQFADKKIDAQGGLVMPGIVDPHTHPVFSNEGLPRLPDFKQRLDKEPGYTSGKVYQTINATRQAEIGSLGREVTNRLARMAQFGVTTVEAKSGYFLTKTGELNSLGLVYEIGRSSYAHFLPRTVATLLGCHFVPKEFTGRRGDYVAFVCHELIPEAAEQGIAMFCDVFVDELPNAFTPDDARKVAKAARASGLKMKLHVDQTSGKLHGAELAAELGVVSADHLDHASDAGIQQLEKSGVVAVLLPYACQFTLSQMPNARSFLDAGVRVALSTDLNPGSSFIDDPWYIAFLGVTHCGMTSSEALRAITVEAAAAIAADVPAAGVGRILPGYMGDMVIIDTPFPEALLYDWRHVPIQAVIRGGMLIPNSGPLATGII